ncbi:MAG: metallophosphoesterase [Chloroflexota bacterium]|nr:metallophosphoesterase [Chloroflexota bacterium]
MAHHGALWPQRRKLFAPLLAVTAISAAAIYQARYVNPFRPILERITIPVPGNHANLAGLRIGFFSDPHLGPTFNVAAVRRAVDLLIAECPDLVLFGGDFISESPRFIEPISRLLEGLARRAPLGAYAVLGNHDVVNAPNRLVTALQAAGVTTLRNTAARVKVGSKALWIAGPDDAVLAQADLAATWTDIPDGDAVIALWHEPDRAVEIAARGAFLQLSGHTHGGQLRFPLIGALVLPAGGQRYVAGHYDVDGMALYVTRGVGVYRPPMRFNCPPEVTLISLGPPA